MAGSPGLPVFHSLAGSCHSSLSQCDLTGNQFSQHAGDSTAAAPYDHPLPVSFQSRPTSSLPADTSCPQWAARVLDTVLNIETSPTHE